MGTLATDGAAGAADALPPRFEKGDRVIVTEGELQNLRGRVEEVGLPSVVGMVVIRPDGVISRQHATFLCLSQGRCAWNGTS